ncbi:class F sortase [Dermacoccaceae bacterium W4C1]
MRLARTAAATAATAILGAAVLAGCSGADEAAETDANGSPPRTASTLVPETSSAAATSSTSSASTSTTSASTSSSSAAPSTSSAAPTSSAAATSSAPQVRSGTPVRLEMPTLGFDQPVRALGLNGGAIDPPPHVVQWYTGSPRPGATGISVIAGHVAPYGGQAGIFSKLPNLTVGSTVTIGYAGGGERTFRVYAKEAVGKTALQRDARVWGTSSTPVVALITCDATAEHEGGHSTKNYVVWARPA